MITVKFENKVKMPRLGLGVWQCGDKTEDAVKYALQAGYRLIDTAAEYGNEKAVGKAIRESGIPREKIFITTKLWNSDIRKGRAKEAFFDSFKRLQTDYIDMYLIHWPAEGFQKAWQDMTEIYHEGWVRAIGVSNFQIHHAKELENASDVIPFVNQIESHPYFNNQELIDYCLEHKIEVTAYSPLGSNENGLLEDPILMRIARKYGKTVAQVILRWNLQRGITSIPKSVNKKRIEENINIFDFELSSGDMNKIFALNKNERVSEDPDNFNF